MQWGLQESFDDRVPLSTGIALKPGVTQQLMQFLQVFCDSLVTSWEALSHFGVVLSLSFFRV